MRAYTLGARRLHPLPRPRHIPRPRGRVLELLSLAGGLALWEILGRALALPWLPPLSAALAALVDLNNRNLIVPDLVDSVQALAIGYCASLAISFVIALVMAEFEVVNRALGPYVYAMFLLPSIALLPIFLALFGTSETTRLALIFVYPFFYMIINFHTAFSVRDPSLAEMAISLQASRWQRVRFIVIPMALPLVMATVRVGLSRGVKGMINGEQFIALFGLGGLVESYGNQFAADYVFAVILVIAGLALILDIITRLLDARWTRWAD